MVLYSVSFQIENDSMATPMKAAPFNSGMLFCAPIHSCSFEKISSFSSSFHVDNLLCLLLKACELYTSITMSIWMYEQLTTVPPPPTPPTRPRRASVVAYALRYSHYFRIHTPPPHALGYSAARYCAVSYTY